MMLGFNWSKGLLEEIYTHIISVSSYKTDRTPFIFYLINYCVLPVLHQMWECLFQKIWMLLGCKNAIIKILSHLNLSQLFIHCTNESVKLKHPTWLDSVPMAGRSCTELRLWGSQVAAKRDRERKEKRNLISLIGSVWALAPGLEQEGCDTQTAALIKSPIHYHDSISTNMAFTWSNPSQGCPSKTHTLTPYTKLSRPHLQIHTGSLACTDWTAPITKWFFWLWKLMILYL